MSKYCQTPNFSNCTVHTNANGPLANCTSAPRCNSAAMRALEIPRQFLSSSSDGGGGALSRAVRRWQLTRTERAFLAAKATHRWRLTRGPPGVGPASPLPAAAGEGGCDRGSERHGAYLSDRVSQRSPHSGTHRWRLTWNWRLSHPVRALCWRQPELARDRHGACLSRRDRESIRDAPLAAHVWATHRTRCGSSGGSRGPGRAYANHAIARAARTALERGSACLSRLDSPRSRRTAGGS